MKSTGYSPRGLWNSTWIEEHQNDDAVWGLASKVSPVVAISSWTTTSHKWTILHRIAGKLFLGSRLATEVKVNLNPVLLAGWAGLVFNALNAVPTGKPPCSAPMDRQTW